MLGVLEKTTTKEGTADSRQSETELDISPLKFSRASITPPSLSFIQIPGQLCADYSAPYDTMPKRKHSELSGEDASDNFNRVKATRLGHKFERGTQLLFRALKTSRGFERQKLGRRQKTAKSEKDAKTLERLEKEVHVLKVRFLARA